jgi:general secretion pathway protein N
VLKSAGRGPRNRRLKYVRRSLIGLGLLLLAAFALVWLLPARWMLPWIEPRLHGLQLQQTGGLLWNGHADRVTAADGRLLGRLQWQLSRRALLGHVQLQLDFNGPQLAFSGTMRRLAPDRMQWSGVNLRADLDPLPPRLDPSLGQPRGALVLVVDSAELQGGWPMQLQARATWEHAAVRTDAGDVSLGELQLQAQAQAHAGVIMAQLHDDGLGPLQVAARLQLSPLGWRLDASLHPRHPDPALQHWLAQFGHADADGTVHIQRRVGLAASPSAADPEETASP